MEDLGTATTIEAIDTDAGLYRGAFSPQWEIWGPAGGYAASLALRAAGQHCGRARPASVHVHFVGVGRFAPVEVRCSTVRQTSVATSVRVELVQQHPERGEQVVLAAMVWGVDDDLAGFEHQTMRRPDVPDPETLIPYSELVEEGDGRHAFWNNVDYRPTAWLGSAEWERREAGEAVERSWYRFVPTDRFDDPWLDACRSMIVLDLDAWPAAIRGQAAGELAVFAPTIDLTVRFLRPQGDEPWLLGVADSAIAASGLIGHSGQVWNQARELVAVGGSTLLCRPAARRPDQ